METVKFYVSVFTCTFTCRHRYVTTSAHPTSGQERTVGVSEVEKPSSDESADGMNPSSVSSQKKSDTTESDDFFFKNDRMKNFKTLPQQLTPHKKEVDKKLKSKQPHWTLSILLILNSLIERTYSE